MELDRVAATIVLENIRHAVPSRWMEKVATLKSLTANGATCSLSQYLDVNGMGLDDVYAGNKSCVDAPALESLTEPERRFFRMLVGSLAPPGLERETTLQQGALLIWAHPQIRIELLDLLDVLAAQREHVALTLPTHPDAPLAVHARYTRIEILAAFNVGEGARVAPWQTGVYWAAESRADLLAFTLDKTTGQFSPTTRYRDYAISPELIH
jgi:hypothetical protein